MQDEDQTVERLLTWLHANNVWMDKRIRISKGDDANGIGVYATAPIPFGITVAKIPKSCVLSVRTCTRSETLFPLLEDLDPNVGLAAALLSEQLLGSRSRWWGYLQSFPPDGADIALFWETSGDDGLEARQWLRGTEADRILNGTLQVKLEYAFKEVVVTALADLQPTWSRFQTAYSLVSSRDFHLDIYHRVGMVPVADAFNHAESNTVYMETDFNVCPDCGCLGECPHDDESGNARVPAGQGAQVEMTCDMVTCAEVAAGQEIFNSYDDTGAKNADLLCHYGFLLEGNSADVIIWKVDEMQPLGNFREDFDDFVEAVNVAGQTDSALKDSNLVTGTLPPDGGNTDELPEENMERDKRYYVDADGRISYSLWVYLFARHAPCPLEEIPDLFHLTAVVLHTIEDAEDAPVSSEYKGIPDDVLRTLHNLTMDVQRLCDMRRNSMHQPHISTSEMAALFDVTHGKRTRLALSYALAERSMLESCVSSWQDVELFLEAICLDRPGILGRE